MNKKIKVVVIGGTGLIGTKLVKNLREAVTRCWQRHTQVYADWQEYFRKQLARVEKMELCTGNISFEEFSALHRKDSIVFVPSDQRGGPHR